MASLFRIDLRFSGSFVELDEGDVSGLSAEAEGVAFDFNDEQVLEDLADELAGLGLGAEQASEVPVEGAGFQPPRVLDAQATETSGWPRFVHGATSTHFLRVEAPASDALATALHDAFTMATVRLDWQEVVAYDEHPTVTVNVVEQPEDEVDPRPPHARRGDGLIAAIEGANEAQDG